MSYSPVGYGAWHVLYRRHARCRTVLKAGLTLMKLYETVLGLSNLGEFREDSSLCCSNEFFYLTLYQKTNFRLSQILQTTISTLMKTAESSPNRKKTLWEKDKLLVTSNFSFFPQCFQKTYTADK